MLLYVLQCSRCELSDLLEGQEPQNDLMISRLFLHMAGSGIMNPQKFSGTFSCVSCKGCLQKR